MPDASEHLLKIVKGSGFPFQLRVQDEVQATSGTNQWEVLAAEHPWKHELGDQGYVDLIVGRGRLRLVIECKRTREASWVFLLPGRPVGAHGGQLRYLWTRREPALFRWHDFYHNPDSDIAEFCIVRGSNDDQSPMLERICRTLVDSTECIADEEIDLSANSGYSGNTFYLPMIVTNARLNVCRFDTSDISLVEGMLGKAEFTEVPYIRFRKTLAPYPPRDILPQDLTYATGLGSAPCWLLQRSRYPAC